jgi:hypothetical protein
VPPLLESKKPDTFIATGSAITANLASKVAAVANSAISSPAAQTRVLLLNIALQGLATQLRQIMVGAAASAEVAACNAEREDATQRWMAAAQSGGFGAGNPKLVESVRRGWANFTATFPSLRTAIAEQAVANTCGTDLAEPGAFLAAPAQRAHAAQGAESQAKLVVTPPATALQGNDLGAPARAAG